MCVYVMECNWKGAQGEIVGVFTHRWTLGGGILIVRCTPLLSPAGITHAGLFLARTLPHFPLVIEDSGQLFIAFIVTAF